MATKKTKQKRQPIILCAGANGRAVIYGYVDGDPVPGEPVELYQARMLIQWAGTGGLFGVAAEGPHQDSRITAAVERTTETVWQEWLSVSPAAAKAMDGWK